MDPTIPLTPVRAFAEPPHIDDAVALLAAAPVHTIGFGFTSSAYVLGAAPREGHDRAVADTGRVVCPWSPPPQPP